MFVCCVELGTKTTRIAQLDKRHHQRDRVEVLLERPCVGYAGVLAEPQTLTQSMKIPSISGLKLNQPHDKLAKHANVQNGQV